VRPSGVQGIAFIGSTPWVATLGGDTVQPLFIKDGTLGDPIRAASGGSLSAITGSGESLWVADLANGSVVRVNPGDGTAQSPLPGS
jgi:hypothetical protein